MNCCSVKCQFFIASECDIAYFPYYLVINAARIYPLDPFEKSLRLAASQCELFQTKGQAD